MKRKRDDEKDKRTSKFDPIPLDLEVEILTRLPVKSLLKFLCVSKIWSSIIRSQRFTVSNFAMSSKCPRFIVALSNSVLNKKSLFLFSSLSNESSSSLVTNLDMTIPEESLNTFPPRPCASVHGFLGVNVGSKFIICNPSTKQVIKLPSRNYFLGYDSIDDQHKVLSLRRWNNRHQEHKVLTLGEGEVEGECWRHMKDTTTMPNYYYPVSEGVCINGFLYYATYTLKNQNQYWEAVIVCFDVRSEKLSFINAPDDALSLRIVSILIEYKGKLASIRRYACAHFHSFDLWVLEDAEKQEWSKQICVVPLSVWESVKDLCFSGTNKAGEIIMAPTRLLSDGPFYIFYYNVDTKNVRRVEIQGTEEIRRRYDSFEVCIIPQHVESISFLQKSMENL